LNRTDNEFSTLKKNAETKRKQLVDTCSSTLAGDLANHESSLCEISRAEANRARLLENASEIASNNNEVRNKMASLKEQLEKCKEAERVRLVKVAEEQRLEKEKQAKAREAKARRLAAKLASLQQEMPASPQKEYADSHNTASVQEEEEDEEAPSSPHTAASGPHANASSASPRGRPSLFKQLGILADVVRRSLTPPPRNLAAADDDVESSPEEVSYLSSPASTKTKSTDTHVSVRRGPKS